MSAKLKQEFLSLLREDPEFRYAVAGLLGLDEILRRLDKHWEELVKLREEANKLREDMNKGFLRHDEEIAKLREDMNKGFLRHDEEIAKLREDMNKGFKLLEGHISALGARWGLLTEEAFREGLRGILEEEFKVEVERWIHRDEDGIVYGYPSSVEVDVAVHDGKVILIEISSHVRPSDVSTFKRKAELYERITGRKPDKLMIVTPYAEDEARYACLKHGIELYTKV
ncbi:MAG: DUF3782 domain-containing protein [Candidatus Bathyarchaeia archaeon]